MKELNQTISTALQQAVSDGTPQDVVERYASLPSRAAQSDFGRFDRNVVVVDTETTGLSFNHDELIQIAAARLEQGTIAERFSTFVNPGKDIPDDIVHLTGITQDDVADAPSPEEALARLVEFVGPDAIMVAHNAEFDRTFTTRHPAGYPLLDLLWIDTLELARIALPRLKGHRLIDLVHAFETPVSTHRADADVEATCAIYRILLAAVDAMPKDLTNHIGGLAPEDRWSTGTVFAESARRAQGESAAFSLKDLRKRRKRTIAQSSKRDAEALACDPACTMAFPDAAEIADAFEPGGLVSMMYGRFEKRAEQEQMSQAVLEAFSTSQNLAVEAGTGVGKSMAYLLPAALIAKRNGITVGVATKTNALLDQLVFHELPLVSEALDGIEVAALKGFSHYPCLRKIEHLVLEGALTKNVQGKEVSTAPALAALLSFIEQTEFDDIDSLKIDFRALPRWSMTTSSFDCLRRKCPYYGSMCFVHGARRLAEDADIVVTNHSLMFCDLKADRSLLPPIRHWVIDEAHGAEAEARKAFSVEIDTESLARLQNRIGADEASKNVLVRAQRLASLMGDGGGAELLRGLAGKAISLGRSFKETSQEFVDHIDDLLFFEGGRFNKDYDTIELWLNDDVRSSSVYSGLAEFNRASVDDAEKLIRACQDIVGFLEDYEQVADLQREIASVALSLKEYAQTSEILFGAPQKRYVYAATLCRKSERKGNRKGNRKVERKPEKLQALVLDVGDELNERLYASTHSVVFTSATLAVGESFESFEQAVGLNRGEDSRATTLQLASSYAFDEHMVVYVPSDIPEPNDPAYLPALQELLVRVHLALQGSALTLFTNRKEMESCFDAVYPALKQHDLRLVCQKWGVSVKGLRDDFLSDESLSLFALKSFWEGFDAPGDTLRSVIIPKLPFAKPTDPLSCERGTLDASAWAHFVLPAAVIETKQAVGRLIRSAEDSGVVLLCDHRLVSRHYGKAFLKSLPSHDVRVLTSSQIIEELERR